MMIINPECISIHLHTFCRGGDAPAPAEEDTSSRRSRRRGGDDDAPAEVMRVVSLYLFLLSFSSLYYSAKPQLSMNRAKKKITNFFFLTETCEVLLQIRLTVSFL
jgi:hypothetical protein